MLTINQVAQIKEELENCKNPIFFFHDDPDGLASFLLLYRYKKEGKGFIIKAHPKITNIHAEKAKEYNADKIFVLDIALMDEDFYNKVKIPVIWIDHHELQKIDDVKYFNPKQNTKENTPTASLCYQVVEQDLWIAETGCIGDWHFPYFTKQFSKEYNDLLPEGKPIEEVLTQTKIGELVKIFSFILKGKTTEAQKAMKIMTRIKNPYEILNQETPQGKWIFKKYLEIKEKFDKTIEKVKTTKEKKIILYIYPSDELSLTKDIANELIAKNPEKIVIVGREKEEEYRCSIRSGKNVNLIKIMQKAMLNIQGTYGGHEHACGAVIKKQDFEKFIEQLEKEI